MPGSPELHFQDFLLTVKRLLYPLLPTPVRIQGIPSYCKNAYLDFEDFLARRDEGEPPRRLNIAGEGEFRTLGKHNLSLCTEYGRLNVHDQVLDVGCGIGRTALAMQSFLEPDGSFHMPFQTEPSCP